MSKRPLILACLAVNGLCLGCASTPMYEAQSKWATQNIVSYTITIEFYENFANDLTTSRTVVVRDGQLVSATCEAAQCPAFVFTKTNTVDDLFAVAQGATLDHAMSYEDCVQALSFDETYGYPKFMQVDCPDWFDDDHAFRVRSFEPLK